MNLKDVALYAFNNGITISFEGVMVANKFPAIQIKAQKDDYTSVRVIELHDLDDGNLVEFTVDSLICDIKRFELEGETK